MTKNWFKIITSEKVTGLKYLHTHKENWCWKFAENCTMFFCIVNRL